MSSHFTGADDARVKQGRARMREIAEQNAREIAEEIARLIAGLGRAPIGGEVIAAELVAATFIKARRLRERGRDDGPERRLLQRLMMSTPFGMVPAPPPVPPKIQIFGPRSEGRTYFVAERGDKPAPDEASVADER